MLKSNLERLIGLAQELTSTWTAKVTIAFPDYNSFEHKEVVLMAKSSFENADFVWEKDANDQSHITVGDILYIRETVHTSQDRESIGNETENKQLCSHTTSLAIMPLIHDEKDNPNNRQSIGFNFYESDIHPFKKDDYIDEMNSKIILSAISNC